MSKQFQSDCATVLDKSARGESALYIRVFCANSGLVHLMKKISAKKTSALPDYFDDISICADAASGGDLFFLRSHELVASRGEIAKDYDAFTHASQISELILKNGAHIENISRLSIRLRGALNSIAAGKSPPIIHLKFLYLLVRDEGYPVLQDFFPRLSAPQQQLFGTLIKTPTEELGDFSSRTYQLLEDLSDWTISKTDIVI